MKSGKSKVCHKTMKMGPVKLTGKEWRAIRDFFRYEENTIRESYGEPGKKDATFLKNYKEANALGAAFYEAARGVFGERP